MNSGLHFESAWQEGHLVYVHTGIRFSNTHALAIPLFPVYLDISVQRLSVHLIDTRNPVHSTLIEIPISESYFASSEYVTAELRRLVSKPFKLPASCSDGPLRDLGRDAGIYWFEQRTRSRMLLAEILIDFLIDLHTSEVFFNCPHLAALRRTIQSNPLFRAIEARAILAYARWQADTHGGQADLQRDLAEAQTRFIRTLLQPDSISIGDSGWFNRNLETEIQDANKQSDNQEQVLQDSLLSAVTDWLLTRFNYAAAYKLIWPNWKQTRFFHAAIPGCLLITAWCFLVGWFEGVLAGGISLALCAAIYRLLPPSARKGSPAQLASSFSLLSPRLLIALIGSWLGYTFSVKSYFNTEVFLVLFYPVVIPLMSLYANREIRLYAPDLPVHRRRRRNRQLLTGVYVLTILLGLLIVSPMVLFTTSSGDWKDFFARAVEENTFVLESPLYLNTFGSMSSEMQSWTADRLVFRLHDPWNPESAIARRQLRALGYSPDSLRNVDADSLKYLIGQIPAASMPGPPLAQLSQVRYPYLGWRVVYRIGHYHFFPVVLLSYGGIVFFITLFLNFLLKGEPLSGWPGRRAG